MLSAEGRAYVDAATGLILLPDSAIDMRSGEWRNSAGELQGRCQTLPRREGYAWVRGMLSREPPSEKIP